MIAEVAAIELRRVVDVLQIEHASLFLHDPDHPQRAASVAAVGLPVDQALVEYGAVVARVMHTGRIHEVQHGSVRGGCSAMAVPLLEGRRAVGALLVVTVRASRRLGTFDAQVIVRAADTLVRRVVAREQRFHRQTAPERFTRSNAEPP
jgi:hypothetical protein